MENSNNQSNFEGQSRALISNCEWLRQCNLCLWALLFSLAICIGALPPAEAQPSPPTLSVHSGSYTTTQKVFINAIPTGGNAYYSLDGSVPTTLYTGAGIPINSQTQFNAVNFLSGQYSTVVTSYIDVDANLLPLLQNASALFLRLRGDFGVATTSGISPPVTTWFDLSGEQLQATSSSGTAPTQTIDLTGPVVKFSGSQYLSLVYDFNMETGCTFFIVTRPASLTPGARMLDFAESANSSDVLLQISPSGSLGQFGIYSGSSGLFASSANPITQSYQLFEAQYVSNSNPLSTFLVNGVAGTPSTLHVLPNMALAANFIGQGSGGGNFYAGNIAEIAVYKASLTPTQCQAIEQYYIHKYHLLSAVPETPTISVPTGTLSGPTQVAIASQLGSTTYITTDGTAPTLSSPIYRCPLTVNYSQTVKAMSIIQGVQSIVASATYTLDSTQWPAPSSGDMTPPSINLQLPTPSLP